MTSHSRAYGLFLASFLASIKDAKSQALLKPKHCYKNASREDPSTRRSVARIGGALWRIHVVHPHRAVPRATGEELAAAAAAVDDPGVGVPGEAHRRDIARRVIEEVEEVTLSGHRGSVDPHLVVPAGGEELHVRRDRNCPSHTRGMIRGDREGLHGGLGASRPPVRVHEVQAHPAVAATCEVRSLAVETRDRSALRDESYKTCAEEVLPARCVASRALRENCPGVSLCTPAGVKHLLSHGKIAPERVCTLQRVWNA